MDSRVVAEIHRLAQAEGLSINKAAAKILKLGAGIRDVAVSRNIGQAVDRFVGSLSKVEAQNAAVADLVRNSERVAFSMVVVGELLLGFEMATAMSAMSPRSTTS